jgi:8-oxo-dGTP diphosphatase
MEAVTRIGIAIVEHAGRFLVGVRGEGSPLPGKAEFPGGKCEAGESSAECAVRECLEETGLAVTAMRLLDQRVHQYPHGPVELSFWLCEPLSPESVAENHQGFRWVSREDLPSLDFPEANRHVLGLLSDTDIERL